MMVQGYDLQQVVGK